VNRCRLRRKEADHSTGRRGSLGSMRWCSSPRRRGSQNVSWNRHGRDRARATDAGVAESGSVSGRSTKTEPHGQLRVEARYRRDRLVRRNLRIFEYDRSVKPTIDSVMQRVHPQDRADFQEVIGGASRGATDFEHAYRLLLPDGRVNHVHAIAHAVHWAPLGFG